MAWDHALDELFTDTVSFARATGIDVFGKRSYGPATTYRARVIGEFVRIVDFFGRDTLSTHTVWIMPNPDGSLPSDVRPEDRLTMSDGSEANILAVSMIPDEDGLHHVKLHTGRAQRVN